MVKDVSLEGRSVHLRIVSSAATCWPHGQCFFEKDVVSKMDIKEGGVLRTLYELASGNEGVWEFTAAGSNKRARLQMPRDYAV